MRTTTVTTTANTVKNLLPGIPRDQLRTIARSNGIPVRGLKSELIGKLVRGKAEISFSVQT